MHFFQMIAWNKDILYFVVYQHAIKRAHFTYCWPCLSLAPDDPVLPAPSEFGVTSFNNLGTIRSPHMHWLPFWVHDNKTNTMISPQTLSQQHVLPIIFGHICLMVEVRYSMGPLLHAWINCVVWDETTYPIPSFNDYTIEVWYKLFHSTLLRGVNTNPCWDYS